MHGSGIYALAEFNKSCRLIAAVYRDGWLSYHDAADGLAVRAEIARIPFELAAPIIARALYDRADDN